MAFDIFVAMERMAALEWATQTLLGFQLTVILTRGFAELPRAVRGISCPLRDL
jgi:hypothetical protein